MTTTTTGGNVNDDNETTMEIEEVPTVASNKRRASKRTYAAAAAAMERRADILASPSTRWWDGDATSSSDVTTAAAAVAFTDFMNSARTSDTSSFTHVSLGHPRGKFNVGRSRMQEFWTVYARAVDAGVMLYVAERPDVEGPVVVDVDLRVRRADLASGCVVLPSSSSLSDDVAPPSLYDDAQLEAVVGAYQSALRRIVDTLDDDDSLTCVALEKAARFHRVGDVEYVKHGFHLHFPKLLLDRRAQEVYVIPSAQKSLVGLFANLRLPDEFIDSGSVKVNWLLYGSRKPGNEPYVATRCFDAARQQLSVEAALADYEFVDGERCVDARSSLARVLSVFVYDKSRRYAYRPIDTVSTPIVEQFAERANNRLIFDRLTIDERVKQAQQYMQLISPERADDRAKWRDIGYCLYDISEGNEHGLALWLEFSEQSPKYDEHVCLYMWKTMRRGQFTLGTLKWLAKLDDPVRYAALMRQTSTRLVDRAIEWATQHDLAALMYNEYGGEFVYSNGQWYQFKDHIWQQLQEKGWELRARISSENGVVIGELNRALTDAMAERDKGAVRDDDDGDDYDDDDDDRNDGEDDDDSGYVAKKRQRRNGDSKKNKRKKGGGGTVDIRIAKIRALIRNCKSSNFKSSTMTECAEMFRDAKFYLALNKNAYLVAFVNGVYDFKNDNFRVGLPEDYLSVALPIEYRAEFTRASPEVVEVDEFFRKVFPDQRLRHYFLTECAELFVGGNRKKQIFFWTGNGDNGKSKTQDLFEQMLGPLAIKFSTTLITGKKSQMGAAAPELARAGNGARWAVMDEPNADEMINAGTLKQLTGNDRYFARDLFEKGRDAREITPLFKLHMICNEGLPAIRDGDEATWNRIRVVPFESKFLPVETCPTDADEQARLNFYPIDENLTERIVEMREPLAWYLIDIWQRTKSAPLSKSVPDKVLTATRKYRHENNVCKQFEEANVVRAAANDPHPPKLSLAAAYESFQEWYRLELPGQQVPPMRQIRDRFCALWGELSSSKHWTGISLRVMGGGGNAPARQADDGD